MIDIDTRNLPRIQRMLETLADAGKDNKVYETALRLTGKQSRTRFDRLIAPRLGFNYREIKNVSPVRITKQNETTAGLFGGGRGFNFARFKYREVWKPGKTVARKKAGLKILGGSRNPYSGYYPHAFVMMRRGHPFIMEYIGNNRTRPLNTNSAASIFYTAGLEKQWLDYTEERLGKNTIRIIRQKYYQLINNP